MPRTAKPKSTKRATAAKRGPGITKLVKINAEAKKIYVPGKMQWTDAIKRAYANLRKKGAI